MYADPVTVYNFYKRIREVIDEDYNDIINSDSNIYDKDYLVQFGKEVFTNIDKIIDITDKINIKQQNNDQSNGFLSRLTNFVPVEIEKARFILDEKPEYGTRSLRRGYYKIVSQPILSSPHGIECWKANVLYNEGPGYKEVYKYHCNVGPLCNMFAVAEKIKPMRHYGSAHSHRKDDFFTRIGDRIIYVSNVQMVNNYDFNNIGKEVLWFNW